MCSPSTTGGMSASGGHVTYPSEFGQLATEGGLYVVLGLVLSLAGIGWVALVVTRS
ncbi:MAG: hypothetical protein QOE92_877, partial [Chloroflexota bacterium]|nr:hypothetical protein [Chloroflexota bacterium]